MHTSNESTISLDYVRVDVENH